MVGRLIDSPGRGQAKEFQVDEAEVVGACDPEVNHPRVLSESVLIIPQDLSYTEAGSV